MFNAILEKISSFGIQRSRNLSIPVLDGTFKPNNLLEQAEVLTERVGLEDMVTSKSGQLYVACGSAVLELGSDGLFSQIASFDQSVTALCLLADERIAVALGNQIIIGLGTASEKVITQTNSKAFTAVTALYPQKSGGMLICDASDQYSCDDWRWDLMSRNRKGRLLQLDSIGDEIKVLASGLAYAFGAYNETENTVLVSESWAHRISRVEDGKVKTVIDRLPGYPCRFAAASDGGCWLTLFCSRTQLVEFVLRENDYREEMMKTIDPDLWIAPSFDSGASFLEPLQGGGVKQMGVLKPWAPPRSYGLVVRFDADLAPQFSLHSRVGGRHHGITAVAEVDDTLYVLSKGAGRIVKLSISEARSTLFEGKDQ